MKTFVGLRTSLEDEHVTVEAVYQEGGLAVHHTLGYGGKLGKTWDISHVESGRWILQYIRTQKEARAFVKRLLELGDWTQPGVVVEADAKMREGAIFLWTELNPHQLGGR
jgi:hypothetical protein